MLEPQIPILTLYLLAILIREHTFLPEGANITLPIPITIKVLVLLGATQKQKPCFPTIPLGYRAALLKCIAVLGTLNGKPTPINGYIRPIVGTRQPVGQEQDEFIQEQPLLLLAANN